MENEWNLVPDSDGKLTMMSREAIYSTEIEGRFTAAADMIFFLFTREDPTGGQRILLEDSASLGLSNFNPANPTRFLIHGWNGNAGATSNILVRNAYTATGDFNVIVVDWGAGANSNYISSRNRVEAVGNVVARFINFLVLVGGQRLDQIAVIGHSLGGHAAGFAGKHVAVGRVHTIIALDPAGPLFSATDPNDRVDAGDAEYVESIITNGGVLGMMEPIGTTNFYPNGGSSQAGCGIDIAGTCAHARSNEFFAESLRSGGFVGSRCDSFNDVSSGNCNGASFAMGGEPSLHGRGAEGIFFLRTATSSPFALN